ncbi:HAMP domain-containing protein [Frankia sp. AgB1.9]|uniref:sensor histidine kinase n=1 Tax=unclassified Frankia TaxID=2632575 RepID=UPI001934407B|nr:MULTISPECIES: ATP-binding protein [unclassified Frankia]MBL7492186.1 HAMP domain-containing protein [Frankia sp. AgW1.1]MBL7552126.1 HAMP domain-containing protein [Frankia sp. AgB1.9]MBL7622155.1 HAMP domain-containing protein [Frankia sp. AgB1.8]
MSLRIRLTALFGLGTALVLVGVGFLFYLQLRASLSHSLDAILATRAEALRARVVGSTSPDDALAAASPLAQLVDANGHVLAVSPATATRPLAGAGVVEAARTRRVLVTVEVRGAKTRVLAEPVDAADGSRLVLVVGASPESLDDAEDRIRDVMFFACVPLVALSALAAWWLAGAALRPVERMRGQAAAMGVADLGGRLEIPPTRDELAALATTMNDLLDRLHVARAHDRAFVADAGHELRTPLTNLKAELELASRPGRSRADLEEALTCAAVETDRLIRLSEALLVLARFDSDPGQLIHRERMPLAPLLERAVASAMPAARAAGAEIRLDVEGSVDLDADPDRVRQAVDNLLSNALRYTAPGNPIEVTAERGQGGPAAGLDGPVVTITVRDHGPGFPQEFLPQAFERFARADAARGRADGGAGLGLAIVAAVAAAHDGRATAANHPEGGAVVTLALPAVSPPPHRR